LPFGAGSIKNSVVNGINGNAFGMNEVNQIEGFHGKAYHFDGTNTYLTIEGLYTSEQAQGQIDILFRTEQNRGVLIAQDFVGWNNLDSLLGIGKVGTIDVPDGYPVFETHGPNISEKRGVIGSVPVNDGNWHIVSVKWDGVNYSMCIDGVWESDVPSTYGFWGSNGIIPISIARSEDTGPSFIGDICELIIGNNPKSKEEISLFHSNWLNGIIESETENNDFVLGCDCGIRFDDYTVKIFTDGNWRNILTKNVTVHGGDDDGRWYIRNDSSGDPVYEDSGIWISTPISLNGYLQDNSILNWTEYLPISGSISVSTALEQSGTVPTTPPVVWDTATLGMEVPNLPSDTTNYWLWIKIELGTSDSSFTPSVSDFTIGFEKDSNITFNCVIPSGKVKTDLVDFPIKFQLPYMPNLMSQYTWKNLHVSLSDDTECPIELIRFPVAGGSHPFIHFWAKIPNIYSSADTEFFVWFGNDNSSNIGLPGSETAATVWDDDFVFVTHFNDHPKSKIISSKPCEVEGTPSDINFSNSRWQNGRKVFISYSAYEDIVFGKTGGLKVAYPSLSVLYNRRGTHSTYAE
jgi:hypothetical protein